MKNKKWLIDVEHYKDSLERFKEKLIEFEKMEAAECVKTIIKGLKLEPVVDAVEVVRCKYCRFLIDRKDGTHGCYRHFMEECNLDDFCSYGERANMDGGKYEND